MKTFNPPERTLMGPGPSNLHPRVLAALSRPIVGHLDPAFAGMMEELKVLLRDAFRTENALTYPVSAPGSAGMETCFVNLVEAGDKVIVCRNGVFGGRMIENANRYGANTVVVEDEWGKPVDPQKLEDALKANPDTKIVAFVQAETSTGAESDTKTLTEIAHRHGALVIVDAVTALGGTPVKVDEWGVDAIYAGSQKCLSCVPGLSPVSFGERAIAKLKARKTPVPSWFLDLNLVLAYWNAEGGKRTYHHTAPVNSLYALHESLLLLQEEGLEKAWARHRAQHEMLAAGLTKLGLEFVVPAGSRLPQLNAVKVPAGVDEAALRARLLNDYNLEIGAGLGPLAGKVWRIGLMGYTCRQENVLFCLAALADVISS